MKFVGGRYPIMLRVVIIADNSYLPQKRPPHQIKRLSSLEPTNNHINTIIILVVDLAPHTLAVSGYIVQLCYDDLERVIRYCGSPA